MPKLTIKPQEKTFTPETVEIPGSLYADLETIGKAHNDSSVNHICLEFIRLGVEQWRAEQTAPPVKRGRPFGNQSSAAPKTTDSKKEKAA